MAERYYRPADTIDHRLVRMARAGLGLSVRELAERSGLNKATIVRLEAGISVRGATLQAVRAALELCGAEFLTSSDGDLAAVSVLLEGGIRDGQD